jgi:hypothetical protein
MWYEINVALRGKHFFATAEHSLTDEKNAELVFWTLASRFKKSDGYTLSMSHITKTGRDATPAEYKA